MKLVIDIPEDVYKRTTFYKEFRDLSDCVTVLKAIDSGTPLPKNHGRLIDADYLKDVILLHSYHGNNKDIVPYSDRKGYRLRQREVDERIINAPTVIEADGGEQE